MKGLTKSSPIWKTHKQRIREMTKLYQKAKDYRPKLGRERERESYQVEKGGIVCTVKGEKRFPPFLFTH